MSKPQLFCFTHAGGSASFFDVIEKNLPGIDLFKIEYAGHGARYKESFLRDFDELADDVYSFLKANYLNGEYALFGYSMGSITLVEVLKRIIDDKVMKKPFHVFLAAFEPYSKAKFDVFSDVESDEWVKRRTIKFGAVPDKLISNKSFWRVHLPLYRADYSIIGKYRFEDLELHTQIPATFFYSEIDTPRAGMELWRNYFVGDCSYHEFQGNHFFIHEHHWEMAQIISSKMQ